MNLTKGILNRVTAEPDCSKYMMANADATRTEAQNVVVRDKAPFGPLASKVFPYPIKSNKDAGLTKAIASGKAAGASAYPVAAEVNMANVEGRANEYPR